MRADNLDSTADEQRDEQEVEEVRQTNPQRKVVSGYSIHSAYSVLSLACFTKSAILDRAMYNSAR
jgi:hypothetical protein